MYYYIKEIKNNYKKFGGVLYMFNLVPFRKNNNIEARRDLMSEFFDNFFNDDFFMNADYLPVKNGFKVDIKEDENNYTIEADLPGVKKDSINITYENNYLSISTARQDEYEEKKDNFIRKERHYGEFKRSFYVDNIDDTKIKAEFKDGVLKIIVPKLEKIPQSKKIEIQ
jgi:HSP20 family protein